jgi:hypothetical protein
MGQRRKVQSNFFTRGINQEQFEQRVGLGVGDRRCGVNDNQMT